ncbi:MalY/PatB family protein [Paenibacillus yanchengensis]|uniref:cysteine-S-conjugate beta-lyase n=1 Tax=Paenibacillus yanchengensis TaxID=2035833 RepID=A0ABW4YQT9_9BACL
MTTIYNFDKVIDRRGTGSVKWDQTKEMFGHEDILPMWVADMDFTAPPAAITAMQERAAHGVFGYTFRTDSYLESIVQWQQKRNEWQIEKDAIVGSPGVVTALSIAVELLTAPGDGIMIHVPVYHPFFRIVHNHKRTLVGNRLVETETGRYELDLQAMEKQIIDEQVKMLILCHPHNPVGRVWTKEELLAIGNICMKHNVFVVSDEIHGDIVFAGHKHIPFASLSEQFAARSITCTAPSKTFNIAGLHSSITIIQDEELRKQFIERLSTYAIYMENCFAQVAVEACYRHGEDWLEQLLVYLQQNVDTLQQFIADKLPEVKMFRPEGTYLGWLDCRAISNDPEVLKDMMFNKAKVAFNEGSMFGQDGAGFLRVNFGTPRALMLEGMERFAQAVRQSK